MKVFRMTMLFAAIVALSIGSVAAEDGEKVETFLALVPVQEGVAVDGADAGEAFKGLSDLEMIDRLYELSAEATVDMSWPLKSAPEVPGLDLLDSLGLPSPLKRPVVPPPLLVAGMAAQAIKAVETGACAPCSFGENVLTGRRGLDIRWTEPIAGYPNAYLYRAFADIPLDPGEVVQIPPDTDMIVEAAKRAVTVYGDPSVVIESTVDSGGGINFYYWFSYDLGEGPRAFYIFELRVMEIGK